MQYTRGLEKLVSVQLKNATKFYGVNCEIYPVINDNDSGLQAFGDVTYTKEPIYSGKFLIPEYTYRTSSNPYGFSDFTETTFEAYSEVQLPRLAKVIITEIKDLVSFIISDIKDARDSTLRALYYTYTFIPSSQLLRRPGNLNNLIELDETLESGSLDILTNESLRQDNEQSEEPVSSRYIYEKL